jgi:hypothetical protein
MIWRLTMYFSGNNQGWSEEVYHQDAQNSAISVSGYIEQMITKRVAFLPKPYLVHAYRVSAYTLNDGTAAPTGLHFFQRKQFKTSKSATTYLAEPANVALQMLMLNTDQTKSVLLYLGAPPDDAVSAGGVVDPSQANLGADWDNYIAFLTATNLGINNGWAQVGTPVDAKVASYAFSADGLLIITTSAPHGIAVSTKKLPARIRRFNGGKSALNGQLLVESTGLSELTSVEKIAALAGQTGGFIKVYPQFRSYVQFSVGVKMLQTMKHRRGLPFGSIRGRRPARVRA